MLESASRYFQLGESPSRGLLRDCETDGSSAALVITTISDCQLHSPRPHVRTSD